MPAVLLIDEKGRKVASNIEPFYERLHIRADESAPESIVYVVKCDESEEYSTIYATITKVPRGCSDADLRGHTGELEVVKVLHDGEHYDLGLIREDGSMHTLRIGHLKPTPK